MGKFLWLKFLKTNGENIIKCMLLLNFPVQRFCIDVYSVLGQYTLEKGPTTKA